MDRALTWRPYWDALPHWGRRGVLAGIGLLVILLLTVGGWYWWERQREAGQTAFDQAFVLYRQAMASGAPELSGQARQALEGVAKRYPRHSTAPLASYALGNLHYRARDYDKAVASFEQAARTGRGGLRGVSQLGLGYALEGRGETARAMAVYQDALGERNTKDPFYGEFLLALARTQVAMKRPGDARETYQRFLRELPSAPQAEDVKIRLASLEEARTP